MPCHFMFRSAVPGLAVPRHTIFLRVMACHVDSASGCVKISGFKMNFWIHDGFLDPQWISWIDDGLLGCTMDFWIHDGFEK